MEPTPFLERLIAVAKEFPVKLGCAVSAIFILGFAISRLF
jgi:hypothetical protein